MMRRRIFVCVAITLAAANPAAARKPARADVLARAGEYIVPDSGRVLMSELMARQRGLRATIDVSYQSEPLLGCLVPIEMREDSQDRRGAHITAHARYGRFRSSK